MDIRNPATTAVIRKGRLKCIATDIPRATIPRIIRSISTEGVGCSDSIFVRNDPSISICSSSPFGNFFLTIIFSKKKIEEPIRTAKSNSSNTISEIEPNVTSFPVLKKIATVRKIEKKTTSIISSSTTMFASIFLSFPSIFNLLISTNVSAGAVAIPIEPIMSAWIRSKPRNI